jgi:hypothetical protein
MLIEFERPTVAKAVVASIETSDELHCSVGALLLADGSAFQTRLSISGGHAFLTL